MPEMEWVSELDNHQLYSFSILRLKGSELSVVLGEGTKKIFFSPDFSKDHSVLFSQPSLVLSRGYCNGPGTDDVL